MIKQDNHEDQHEDQLEKYREGKELTAEYTVEGIGTVKVYGTLDFDGLVKRLLQTKYINC